MKPDREQLARDYKRLALGLAWRYCTRYEELDEVRGDALFGLAQAIDTYQEDKGPFFAWAGLKIYAAIRDGRRGRDHLSRSHRRALDGVDFDAMRADEKLPRSLDQVIWDSEDGEIFLGDTIPSRELPIEEGVALRDQVRRLPARERFVLLLHQDGVTLREIGELLDLTESRICQINTAALRTLREAA